MGGMRGDVEAPVLGGLVDAPVNAPVNVPVLRNDPAIEVPNL